MIDSPAGTKRYSGLIRLSGPDGVTWDVVIGTLEEAGDNGRFVGVLRKPADAAMAWWVGPVHLEVPGRAGRVQAFLEPAREEGDEVIVRVSGRNAPWETWAPNQDSPEQASVS
ncbi:MAG: hypothetical protein HKN91_16980 [Acidimicrobiia bacterium]|nr:hypothetical protein [Acidimicrobiia bacterium]